MLKSRNTNEKNQVRPKRKKERGREKYYTYGLKALNSINMLIIPQTNQWVHRYLS